VKIKKKKRIIRQYFRQEKIVHCRIKTLIAANTSSKNKESLALGHSKKQPRCLDLANR